MRVAHACDGNAASFVLTGWRGLGSRRDVGEAASHGHVRRPGGGRHLGLPGFCSGALLNVRIRQGFREPLSRMTPGFHENTVVVASSAPVRSPGSASQLAVRSAGSGSR